MSLMLTAGEVNEKEQKWFVKTSRLNHLHYTFWCVHQDLVVIEGSIIWSMEIKWVDRAAGTCFDVLIIHS